jgi:antimicrobial peptide system SdpB family protein
MTITRLLDYFGKSKPWTDFYGLARTVIATGTFLTLVFNSTDILFKSPTAKVNYCDPLGISLYCFVENMEVGRFLSIFLLLPVIIGWRPMITGAIHWWVTYSFVNSAVIIDGGDHIASIICLLLLPVTLTDTRKWHWAIEKTTTNITDSLTLRSIFAYTSLIIIKIQVSVIYLNSAAAKLFVTEWIDGTAIYYWFNHPVFGHPSWLGFLIEPLMYNGTSLFLITWGTIIFEFILFSGLFMKNSFKKYLLVVGIIFHFGIFIIHGLASFFFTMSAALILYLAPIGYIMNITVLVKKIKQLFYDTSIRIGFSSVGNGTNP